MNIVRLKTLPYRTGYARAAQLHIDRIHHGMLPILGEKFLARMYFELDHHPKAAVWGVVESGRIVGFIAGCIDLKKTYLRIVFKSGIKLFVLSGNNLKNGFVLRNLFSVLIYPFKKSKKLAKDKAGKNTGEILAIAVDQENQRHGVATKLVAEFEKFLQSKNDIKWLIVATNREEFESNSFYKNNGFKKCHIKKHHNLTLQVYTKYIR